MNFTKAFIVFSLTNFVVLLLASFISGGYVVFGNVLASPVKALVMTSLLVALAVSAVGKIGDMYKLKYSENVWMLIYLAINVVLLYALARSEASEVVGFGIKRFWVAVVVGIILNFAQYMSWKTFIEGKKKK